MRGASHDLHLTQIMATPAHDPRKAGKFAFVRLAPNWLH
jgi:hypothetical protein